MGVRPGVLFTLAAWLAFAPATTLRAQEEKPAADMPTFRIEMKDGVITPATLDVPANTRFRLEIVNTGETPSEFESEELKREKAVAPHSSAILVFRKLDPGSYPFFDDFHPEAKAILVAK